jgi:hypothetical protein
MRTPLADAARDKVAAHAIQPFADRIPAGHLGRDDGEGVVTAPQLQRANGVGRDDRGQRLIAHAQPDLCEAFIVASQSSTCERPTKLSRCSHRVQPDVARVNSL